MLICILFQIFYLMTKLLKLLTLVLILPFFAQCTKEKNNSEPKQPTPNYHPIVGQWNWEYSIYWGVDTVFSSPDSIQHTANFHTNDTVYYETFHKGNIIPASSRSEYYEVIMHFDGKDSVPAITLDGIRRGFGIYSDQLLIDMSRNDQGSHWYIRN